MEKLDPRLNAYRDDLADITLKGRVNAQKFVEGVKHRIIAPVSDIKKAANFASGTLSQMLLGDEALVFENHNDFCFIRSLQDGYVGYVASSHLSVDKRPLTHRVKVPRSFIYPMADLKTPPITAIAMNSKLTIGGFEETRGTRYAMLEDGKAIIAEHIEPIDVRALDFVCVAESLIHTPYLWGGTTAFGIDCSGLVQLSFAMAGRNVMRDSDMQQHSIGHEIPEGLPNERGDLIFWQGHVAIMIDKDNIIHANGASMDVRIEPLNDAISRIAKLYGRPTCYRRPESL
ncbi:NlpC/P60 family protein [Bartonella sp. HY329]|uniref:C40 family peptidase n=1 Tax=unclassified Bartonella TaxID=2645622 RepID=UPI0021CA7912|nr:MULTISPECIES: NlpC/P60 family protein [unclassified Bartonella]UXM95644.1 NlpC/P60 family protein [Bartonella sp. HY329]UXN09969.1 NlpC/P60 family protein [Bartonella sp. HY328]